MSSSVGDTAGDHPPSVFLSYASEDREAARLIGDALAGFGLEVWLDESELGGGDLWDQKIRKQIRDCDYFMPIVSGRTEARHEGYFRREWRLAVERTLDMADDHPFLLPVVIDDTNQTGARVPEKFLLAQWLRVPGGRPTPALEALCRRIKSGETAGQSTDRKTTARSRKIAPPALRVEYPQFPKQEPGQHLRFGLQAIGWAFRSGWIFFNRLPRWVRILAYVWLSIALLSSRGCSSSSRHPEHTKISPATEQKLNAIAEQYHGNLHAADVAKLGMQIANELAKDDRQTAADPSPLLATPFTASAGDTAGEKLADTAFAQVYGRIAISHHGHVGLITQPLPSRDLGAALERARASRSSYVLWGTVDQEPGKVSGTAPEKAAMKLLTVKIAEVADGSIVWSKAYPVAGADPTLIAAEVDSNVPSLDEK
ncbi:MAG: toll/interleukin-1 receptor domain-containing protein [Pseudomonadota bacterium]|nr:toll/interleukin-1 receptor domain-containing protein [Pseudomonadota bacterium]